MAFGLYDHGSPQERNAWPITCRDLDRASWVEREVHYHSEGPSYHSNLNHGWLGFQANWREAGCLGKQSW